MIRTIRIRHEEYRHNWIDQNGRVFGYYDERCCCEDWGWAVWNPETREQYADEPDSLPFHFDSRVEENVTPFRGPAFDCQLDCVHIKLFPDSDAVGVPPLLVFECWTDHNGYYLHDFTLTEQDVEAITGKKEADKCGR